MAGLGRVLMSVSALAKNWPEATSRPVYMVCRGKFTRSRIPPQYAEKHFSMHETQFIEVDGVQQQKTTSGSSSVSQEQESETIMCAGSQFFSNLVFEERSKEHELYGGDPEQPHKLHIVTRVKSTMRRPYWEKKVVKSLGLEKSHEPRIHKNTPSVNNQLKIIKHLVRIQPLKLPDGLPSEEEMAGSYLNSKGELVIKHLRVSEAQKTTES